MATGAQRLNRLFSLAGALLIALSLALNPHFMGHVFNSGEEIQTKSFRLGIVAFECLLFAAGLYACLRPSWFAVRWRELVLVFCSAVLTLLLVIVFFELGHVLYPNHLSRTDQTFMPYPAPGRQGVSGESHLTYLLNPNLSSVHYSRWGDFAVRVESNSLGFRDFERNLSECGSLIIGLGDSFAFGQGVELNQSFFSLLEGKLDADSPDGVCVLKAAMPGFGIHQMDFMYTNLADKYPHTMVLLSYIEDDLNRTNNSFVLVRGNLFREKLLPLVQFCPDGSYHTRKKYLNGLFHLVYCNSYVYYSLANHVTFSPVFSLELLDEKPAEPDWQARPLVNQTNEDYFLDMKTKASNHNASLVVIALCQENASYRRFFDSNNITYVEIPCGRQWHFDRDSHLNALGHKLVADRIYGFLKSANMSLRFGIPV